MLSHDAWIDESAITHCDPEECPVHPGHERGRCDACDAATLDAWADECAAFSLGDADDRAYLEEMLGRALLPGEWDRCRRACGRATARNDAEH